MDPVSERRGFTNRQQHHPRWSSGSQSRRQLHRPPSNRRSRRWSRHHWWYPIDHHKSAIRFPFHLPPHLCAFSSVVFSNWGTGMLVKRGRAASADFEEGLLTLKMIMLAVFLVKWVCKGRDWVRRDQDEILRRCDGKDCSGLDLGKNGLWNGGAAALNS